MVTGGSHPKFNGTRDNLAPLRDASLPLRAVTIKR